MLYQQFYIWLSELRRLNFSQGCDNTLSELKTEINAFIVNAPDYRRIGDEGFLNAKVHSLIFLIATKEANLIFPNPIPYKGFDYYLNLNFALIVQDMKAKSGYGSNYEAQLLEEHQKSWLNWVGSFFSPIFPNVQEDESLLLEEDKNNWLNWTGSFFSPLAPTDQAEEKQKNKTSFLEEEVPDWALMLFKLPTIGPIFYCIYFICLFLKESIQASNPNENDIDISLSKI